MHEVDIYFNVICKRMTESRNTQYPYVLYADDDPDDLYLLKETFLKTQPTVDLVGHKNGREVFEFLESIPAGEPLPGIIILDLNMPVWNGTATLEAIKRNDSYKNIPVYIFTNSDHPKHREAALTMGAKDFIMKPYRKDDLFAVCNELAAQANNNILYKKKN